MAHVVVAVVDDPRLKFLRLINWFVKVVVFILVADDPFAIEEFLTLDTPLASYGDGLTFEGELDMIRVNK